MIQIDNDGAGNNDGDDPNIPAKKMVNTTRVEIIPGHMVDYKFRSAKGHDAKADEEGSKLIDEKRQDLRRRLQPTDRSGIGVGYVTMSEAAALGVEKIGQPKPKGPPTTRRKGRGGNFLKAMFNNR